MITDYIEEKDAEKIVDVFGDVPLLTGGSGLMEALARKYCQKNDLNSSQEKIGTEGPAIILSGSCSTVTLEQIRCYQEEGGVSFQIHPLDLLSGKQTIEIMWEFIKNHLEENVLVYSSDDAEQVKQVQKQGGTEKVAKMIEETMAELAKRSLAIGINRIIVAGGETSGAVMRELHYHSYAVSESVAPGVPVMIPLDNVKMRLVLKSGNFGQRDFFQRALTSTSV